MAIPSNIQYPGSYTCADVTENETIGDCCGTLFIWPKSTAGTGEFLTKYNLTTLDQVAELVGFGTTGYDMAELYFNNNSFPNATFILVDNTSATKAALTYTFSGGPATQSGDLNRMIAGFDITIPVIIGDTADDLAAKMETIINNDPRLGVTASADQAVLTITAVDGGDHWNGVDLLENPRQGQSDPDGVTTSGDDKFAGGGSNPDISDALDIIGDCCFDFYAVPWNDPVTISELNLHTLQRAECGRPIGGRFYTHIKGDFQTLSTFGDNNNQQYGTFVEVCDVDFQNPWSHTAAYVGRAHGMTCENPLRPWINGQLIGIESPIVGCAESCLDREERTSLSRSGISTLTSTGGGIKRIADDIAAPPESTGQSTNDFFRYPQYYYTAMGIIRGTNEFINTNFVGKVITDNTERPDSFGSISNDFITTALVAARLNSFMRANYGAYIENIDDFIISIVRSLKQAGRVDINSVIDIPDGLRQVVHNINFRVNGVRLQGL